MTGLIKSAASGFDSRIRPLAFAGLEAASPPPPDPELLALRLRVLELEALLAERESAAETLALAADAALEESEAAGREAGRREAEDRSGEAIALLRDSGKRAVAALEQSLEGADRLAALLASICLEKMLGAQEGRPELVGGLIRHRMASLREEAIVEIRVSAQDFASAEQAAAAAPGCSIIVSDALASGDCTIRLKLGGVDIGLDQQWGVLRAALEDMAGGEGAQ